MIHLKYAFLSDTGKVRKNNQDYVGIFKNKYGVILTIVADGVGGRRGGDVASEMAVSHIGQLFESSRVDNESKGTNWLKREINAENRQILKTAESYTDLSGMGTTIVVAMFIERTVLITNLGDSRCYRYEADNNSLTQLSTDHSLVNEMIQRGELTEEEARIHPQKNIITRSLGISNQIKLDISSFEMNNDDQFLLCTDGLTNQVDDPTLSQVLGDDALSLEEKCTKLVDMANAAGGPDNITALVVKNDQEEVK